MAAAIEVHELGKKYRIGRRVPAGVSLRELLSSPLQMLRQKEMGTPDIHWALRDANFEIGEGERVGLIGRNGAGKSTLLKLLARISHPSTGRIRIRGRVASLLEVGTGFHPELTGRENIYLNAAMLGMGRRDIRLRFDEIVAFSEVEKFLDTPVKRYSSGMYMRLAFAVAAHIETDILLVDEVLAVGDAAFQKKCLTKMDDVAEQGRTVVFVSHRMNAVEALCNRVMVLAGGCILEDSRDVHQAIHDYLASYENDSPWQWRYDATRSYSQGFRPLGLYVSDAKGCLVERAVARDEQCFINIECEIRTDDPGLIVGYALYAEGGELLYWTLFKDGPEPDWPATAMGKNHFVTEIPRQFLNEGDYRIEMIAGYFNREWFCQPGHDAPRVHLSVQGGFGDSPFWMERRPGLLAPSTGWKNLMT